MTADQTDVNCHHKLGERISKYFLDGGFNITQDKSAADTILIISLGYDNASVSPTVMDSVEKSLATNGNYDGLKTTSEEDEKQAEKDHTVNIMLAIAGTLLGGGSGSQAALSGINNPSNNHLQSSADKFITVTIHKMPASDSNLPRRISWAYRGPVSPVGAFPTMLDLAMKDMVAEIAKN